MSDFSSGGKHCVDETSEYLRSRGLLIQNWLTYNNEDNYSEKVIYCPDYDWRIVTNATTYTRLVIWTSTGRQQMLFLSL